MLASRSGRAAAFAAGVAAVAVFVAGSLGCDRVQKSAAEREIADRDLYFTFQGKEQALGCPVSQVLSKMRGHAVFEWKVEVEKPADQQWRLKLRGVGQFDRKPTTWDISLRPAATNAGALVAYAHESDGDEMHPDQLYTFLFEYCQRARPH